MSIHKISDYANLAPKEFIPEHDGPAITINFPDNAPGFRRITAADGTGTIKYLLEITATDGVTATIARALKLYTYNIQTAELIYLYTLSGLPEVWAPFYDYSEAFWVNVEGGYFCFESDKTIWLFGLEDGALWGNSGVVTPFVGMDANLILSTIVPHPTNVNIFNFVYSDPSRITSVRQVTVDPINKTVDWGTQTTYGHGAVSYSGKAMPDTRSTANPGDWVIGRISADNDFYYNNPLVLNPATGVMTAAPNSNFNVSNSFMPGARFIDGDDVVFGGYNMTNMTFYKGNPWVNDTTTNLPSWGASGVVPAHGFQEYFNLDGATGKYYALADANGDVWMCKTAPDFGLFGNALFRASDVVPDFTISGGIQGKPIIACKNGILCIGHMNTTDTTAPVIWYPLKPA